MTEEAKRLSDLEAEIETVKTAQGYHGLNNFRAYMPGGYRLDFLNANPDFGNDKAPDLRKGLSLREFAKLVDTLRNELGIDENKVRELQQEALRTNDPSTLNDYIFPVYRSLRLEGFSHPNCAS